MKAPGQELSFLLPAGHGHGPVCAGDLVAFTLACGGGVSHGFVPHVTSRPLRRGHRRADSNADDWEEETIEFFVTEEIIPLGNQE